MDVDVFPGDLLVLVVERGGASWWCHGSWCFPLAAAWGICTGDSSNGFFLGSLMEELDMIRCQNLDTLFFDTCDFCLKTILFWIIPIGWVRKKQVQFFCADGFNLKKKYIQCFFREPWIELSKGGPMEFGAVSYSPFLVWKTREKTFTCLLFHLDFMEEVEHHFANKIVWECDSDFVELQAYRTKWLHVVA